MDSDEEQPSMITKADTLQGAAGAATPPERRSSGSDPADVSMDNSSQAMLHPQISASTYFTILPCESGFDSMAQAVVHGSVDALPEPELNTFEASGGMAVFDNDTRCFLGITQTEGQEWCAVRRVVKRRQKEI